MTSPRKLIVPVAVDLENPVLPVYPTVETQLNVVGTDAALTTLLSAEKTAAANDIKKSLITEIGLPLLGIVTEWSIYYLAEHAKRTDCIADTNYCNVRNPVEDDWGQTIVDFALPIAVATMVSLNAYRDAKTAGLGLLGTGAAAAAGAGFKALGFNNSLPLDGACRSLIHAGLGMFSSSAAKAMGALATSRFSTFQKKPQDTTLTEQLINNENESLSQASYRRGSIA